MSDPIIETIATRERCGVCNRISAVGFWVPSEIWEAVVHPSRLHDIHCLACFADFADAKMVEWSRDIKFYPVSLVLYLAEGWQPSMVAADSATDTEEYQRGLQDGYEKAAEAWATDSPRFARPCVLCGVPLNQHDVGQAKACREKWEIAAEAAKHEEPMPWEVDTSRPKWEPNPSVDAGTEPRIDRVFEQYGTAGLLRHLERVHRKQGVSGLSVDAALDLHERIHTAIDNTVVFAPSVPDVSGEKCGNLRVATSGDRTPLVCVLPSGHSGECRLEPREARWTGVDDVTVSIEVDREYFRLRAGEWIGASLRKIPPVADDQDLWQVNTTGSSQDTLIEDRQAYLILGGEKFFTAPKVINVGASPYPGREPPEPYSVDELLNELSQAPGEWKVYIEGRPCTGFDTAHECMDLMSSVPTATDNKHRGRIVGWVKYDGDEYHEFHYQTEDPRPHTVELMKNTGYLPLYTEPPASGSASDNLTPQEREEAHRRAVEATYGVAGDES